MGLLTHHEDSRTALLLCDECDHFFCDGHRSEKSRRESTPDDLAPFFKKREDIPPSAVSAGWKVTIGKDDLRARWACPECAREES